MHKRAENSAFYRLLKPSGANVSARPVHCNRVFPAIPSGINTFIQMLDISLNNADNYGGRHENYLCRVENYLCRVASGRWRDAGRCKRSTTVEKWMCRLHGDELYRLKFRKKFVKNGQEEADARVRAPLAGGCHARACIRKSTFTNDPLHLSPPWDMSYDREPRKKTCLFCEM